MKIAAIVLILLLLGLTLFSAMAAFMSPMFFDAPGSEKNRSLWFAVVCLWILPLTSLISAILAWQKISAGDPRGALLIGAIPPLANGALIGIGMLLA